MEKSPGGGANGTRDKECSGWEWGGGGGGGGGGLGLTGGGSSLRSHKTFMLRGGSGGFEAAGCWTGECLSVFGSTSRRTRGRCCGGGVAWPGPVRSMVLP